MRVAMVQLQITDHEAPERRLQRVLGIIESVCDRSDVVMLPELWLTGAFATKAAVQAAQQLDGPVFAAISETAATSRVHVLAGSLTEATDSGRPYNTAVVFGPDGSRAAVYRKIHLFGFDGGEADAFTPGLPEPAVWDSPWGPLGLATCYDLRFPELFRAQVDRGALGFLVPTGWPSLRIARWDVLAQARAIENQAWLIGVNAVGKHSGFDMGGHSIVVDPTGDVRLLMGADERITVVDVDLAAAAGWRDKFPALRDRRL